MLKDLTIRNFAIIDELELSFNPGFNVFTGETGAGKSIILDAVSAALGGKTDSTLVREGTERASVEAVFQLDHNRQAVEAILEREDLLDNVDEGEIVLVREIRAEGRSSARINGHSVNTNLMREVGQLLVDIHGQSDHLSLLNPASHITLLDRFAANQELLQTYRTELKKLQKIRANLAEIRLNDEELLRKKDMLTFQINEIQSAKVQVNEEETLKNDRDRLANAEKLSEIAQEAVEQLEGKSADYPGIMDLIGYLNRAMDGLARIDPSLASLNESVIEATEQLNDVLASLTQYLESLEFNPKKLESIEDRLILLSTLKRKYGGSLEAVIAFEKQAKAQLAEFENVAERTNELEHLETETLSKISSIAQELSEKRHLAADSISRNVEKELHELRMPAAQFKISFSKSQDEHGLSDKDGSRLAYNENGFDQLEFLIAPNPGEGLKPMAKIASGGETSRLMLALKNTLAVVDDIPTMIFDEIDQGISGMVGSIVGEKLWQLSRNHQVLCITHLPQLAAYNDEHFHVTKRIENQRTLTQVEQLSPQQSLDALAQLLGSSDQANIQAANAMIEKAQKTKHNLK